MTIASRTPSAVGSQTVDYATFHTGTILLGIDIRQVKEINWQLDVTPVPRVAEPIRGVLNLRGEVVTVVDLRTVLGMGQTEITAQTRNIIVNSRGEQVGILVDRIADVVTTKPDTLERPPANFHGIEGGFFRGVHKLDAQLLVVLDVEAVLGAVGAES